MKKLTIGLIVDEVDNNFTNEICRGAKLAAWKSHANLIVFFGGFLENESLDYNYQKNTIFSYANTNDLDLLIISVESVVKGTKEIKEQFIKRFPNIPIVTLNATFEGCSSVVFDNTVGLESALEFMINDLGKKHFAMMAGKKGNYGATLRQKTFEKVLNKYQLLTDENQIFYNRSLDRNKQNEEDIEKLLQNNPQMDALVCFNDETAISAYQVLKKHHKRIGKDVAVLGFDDIHESSKLDPPLSSISAPPSYLGYVAVINGMKMLEKGQLFHEILPTHFRLRESLSMDYFQHLDIENQIKILIKNHDIEALRHIVKDYVFGIHTFMLDEKMLLLIDKIIDCIIFADFNQSSLFILKESLYEYLNELLGSAYLHIIDTNRFIHMIDMIAHQSIDVYSTHHDIAKQNHLYFKDMLIDISLMIDSQLSYLQRKNYEDNHSINLMARKMMVFNNKIECYTNILDALIELNVQNASLLLFEEPIYNRGKYHFNGTEVLEKVGSIYNGQRIVDSHIKMPMNKIFTKDDICLHTPTVAVTSIYANEILYGVLLCDMFLDSFSFLEFLDIHIGSSINTLHLISRLEKKSETDQLTGLYNRRGIFKEIPKFLSQRQKDDHIYVVFADLDHLKPINDIYGHDEGDIAIKKAGYILQSVFDENSIIGRVGGDEFLILFRSSLDQIEDIIHDKVIEEEEIMNKRMKREKDTHISYGIKKIEDVDHCIIDDEISVADKLMYVNKMKKREKNKKDIIIM